MINDFQSEKLWVGVQSLPQVANEEIRQRDGVRSGSQPDAPASELDVKRLRSALKVLSPDCSERDWTVYRVGALANSTANHPRQADEIKAIGVAWASGQLAEVPSKSWHKPGEHGKARRTRFEDTWNRFLTSQYTGRRVELGSIFWAAKEVGWTYHEPEPESSETSAEGDD